MDGKGIRSYLCCAVCAIAIALTGTGLSASAQEHSDDLHFEVATVKPADPAHPFDFAHPNGRCFFIRVTPAGVCYGALSVASLVSHAYDIRMFQVAGVDWANVNFFDIEARFPEGANKKDEPKMLQALLKDRFKLAFHIEQRELESYVLVAGKHPERLRPSLPDPPGPEPTAPLASADNAADAPAKPKPAVTKDGVTTMDMGKRGTMAIKFDPEHWSNHNEYSKMTMQELVGRLSNCMGAGMREVQNQTGLKGNYQIAYDCPLPSRPTAMRMGDASGSLPADPQDSSLLDRSLEAMGLKLEKRKVLRDVYVIDHVERPTEN